jgi:PAS domain S-box-containing protein
MAKNGTARIAPAVSARDAESFFQAMLDSLPAHVAVLDDRGMILAVNAAWKAFEATNGGGEGTGVGANYFDVCDRARDDVGRSEAAEVATGLRELLAGVRDGLVVEYPCHGPEEQRWFVLSAARHVGEDATRVVVQHENVTAHRQAEQAARFRSRLLDAVDAAVIALDPDGLVTAWNRGAELLYGWSSGEALGRPAAALVMSDPARAEAAGAMSRLDTDGRWEGELEMQRKDGSRFLAHVRNAALEGTNGRLFSYVSVSVDISGRLPAERDWRSARDYVRAVAATLGDGLCTLDERGRIVYINPRAEELLGWTTADLAGQDLHEVLHHTRPDGSPFPAEECPLVEARRWRRVVRVEDDVLVRRGGTLLPVQQVQTPFKT